MCQKKPGPRCYPHLSKQISKLKQELPVLQAKVESSTRKVEDCYQSLIAGKIRESAQEILDASGDPDPDRFTRIYDELRQQRREELSQAQTAVRKAILDEDKAKARLADLQSRVLGTKTGVERGKKQIQELINAGTPRGRVQQYEQQLEAARAKHEASLKFANWAKKVESGEVHGRFVSSEGTSSAVSVAYSGDPLYDATRKQVAALSDEDLKAASSGRYGVYGMTPATQEKISDERRRREDERSGYPVNQAWESELDSDAYSGAYNGNYFAPVSNDPFNARNQAAYLKRVLDERTVKTSDGKTLSYKEASSRAVAKRETFVNGSTAYGESLLVLDDGTTASVDQLVYSSIRFDRSTGLTKEQV